MATMLINTALLQIFCTILFTFLKLFGSPQVEKVKNVILINSYVQDFAWTDSLTSGIRSELSKYPNIVLHYEYLNSKQFGQSNFDITSLYLKEKYRQIHIDGVVVNDNDALDFAFKYGNELFPSVPIVFAGKASESLLACLSAVLIRARNSGVPKGFMM